MQTVNDIQPTDSFCQVRVYANSQRHTTNRFVLCQIVPSRESLSKQSVTYNSRFVPRESQQRFVSCEGADSGNRLIKKRTKTVISESSINDFIIFDSLNIKY
jgi:hypothetical protein